MISNAPLKLKMLHKNQNGNHYLGTKYYLYRIKDDPSSLVGRERPLTHSSQLKRVEFVPVGRKRVDWSVWH
jgi:hypothetical protein